MKKRILIPLAAAFLLMTGCTKPDQGGDATPVPEPPKAQIIVPSTVDLHPVVPPEGGETRIQFTATAAWTASMNNARADSWVAVSPESGAPGTTQIVITTAANETFVERNATINLCCGDDKKEIVLTQKQRDNITVTTDKVELGAEGGLFTVELKSNIEYGYEISGDWIKYVSTKAYTGKTLTFSADPNEEVQRREGSITVRGGGFSETVKVYQSGAEPSLVISNPAYTLGAEGGSIAVEVSSNMSVRMTIPDGVDWIVESSTKSVSTSTFHFEVAANETYEQKSAMIIFSCGDTGPVANVTVTQEGRTFIHVTGVELNCSELSLTEGEKSSLAATVIPDNATDKGITWTSDSPAVASVNEDGEVSASSPGTAVITVTTLDGGKTATCVVSVAARFFPVTSISLDQSSASLKVGETVTLTATVSPDNATDKTVTWSSSDSSVATVVKGVVTARKIGTATITAKAGDKTATCTVTVIPTPVTSISLDQSSASLKVGETVTLTATVSPDNATDKTVTWSSSDSSVATVVKGVVTARKIGTATITAKAGDKTATCTVTVVPTPVTSVTLNKTTLSLDEKESETLIATVNPSNATEKGVSWSSSDDSVASVNSSGKVLAVHEGKAVITVTTKDGGKTATCAVTVTDPDNNTIGEGGDIVTP